MSTEEKQQRLSPLLRRLLILKLWLIEKFRFGERQVTLVWPAVIGILGALVTEGFRRATDLLHFLFTGSEATIMTSFERLPLWQRFLVPVIGGVLAGLTLWIGNRLIASVRQKSTTDYMEAVVVGNGIILSAQAWSKRFLPFSPSALALRSDAKDRSFNSLR
jgi:CIC family chloride channel protein